jgi:hypothetical protein
MTATANTIAVEHFTKAMHMLLDEAFTSVQGFFLDKGTSLFETLDTISAEEASIPVGGKCATLAAQVKHIAFYLDTVDAQVRAGKYEPVDWGEIWRTTREVSPAEWETIKSNLRDSYTRIKKLVDDTPAWSDAGAIGGAIATVVHSAYHLGEIRQALCVLKTE